MHEDDLIKKPVYAFRYDPPTGRISMYKGNAYFNERHAPGTKHPEAFFLQPGSKFTKYVIRADEGVVEHWKLYLFDDGTKSVDEIKELARTKYDEFFNRQLEDALQKHRAILDKRAKCRRAEFVEA